MTNLRQCAILAWLLCRRHVIVTSSTCQLFLRRFSPAIPYFAVIIGLYLLHNAWITIVLYHLGVLIVLGMGKDWRAVRELLLGFQAWVLLLILLLSLTGGIFTYFAWPFFGLPGLAERLAQLGLTVGSLPWFLLFFTLVNPLLEELFWRGFHGNSASHPLWIDVWFAGYHLPVLAFFVHWYWLPLVLFGLIIISWTWRVLRFRLGGLGVQWLSHITADAAVAIAVMQILR